MSDRVRLCSTPLRDLGLTIPGTRLAPVLEEFQAELERAGIVRLRPEFYLSTEWGVNEGTISIGIPFYLASAELTAIQIERMGYVEGDERAEFLRYLRHEMGHVVNYGYLLHERDDWRAAFGSMDAAYDEAYAIEPFSRRFVLHLPGWYAQKHADEDWSETFAVWMTPGFDWRTAYATWPGALAKLECCHRIMADVKVRDPLVTATEHDEDVGEVCRTVDQHYADSGPDEEIPAGLAVLLRSLFRDSDDATRESRPAAALIRRLEPALVESVHRWTGHGPEATRWLVRGLAACAAREGLAYPVDCEERTSTELATLTAALAMNDTLRGGYFAESE